MTHIINNTEWEEYQKKRKKKKRKIPKQPFRSTENTKDLILGKKIKQVHGD